MGTSCGQVEVAPGVAVGYREDIDRVEPITMIPEALNDALEPRCQGLGIGVYFLVHGVDDHWILRARYP